MNRMDRIFGANDEARVRFSHMEYQVLLPGSYVRCAVTGQRISLDDLRYWDVERQEAYASASVAFERYRQVKARRG